jgi:hypothetical protein
MKCFLAMYILLVQDGDIKKHTSRRKDRADQPRDIMFQRKAFPFLFHRHADHEAAIPAGAEFS